MLRSPMSKTISLKVRDNTIEGEYPLKDKTKRQTDQKNQKKQIPFFFPEARARRTSLDWVNTRLFWDVYTFVLDT